MRCILCGDPNPGVLHLFVRGPVPDLQIGSLMIARRTTSVCDVDEVWSRLRAIPSPRPCELGHHFPERPP